MKNSITVEYIRPSDSERIFVIRSPAKSEKALGQVLIIPPWGRNAHDTIFITEYLNSNGFDVIRFDPRNSVGRGSGQVKDYRLSFVEDDSLRVVDWLLQRSKLPLALLGMSLSAPIAWRVASRVPDVVAVASIVGVLDVGETIEKASDKFLDIERNAKITAEGSKFDDSYTRMEEVLGLSIVAQSFVDDMVEKGYWGRFVNLDLIKALTIPTHFLFAEKDDWIDKDLIALAKEYSSSGSRFKVLPEATHEINRNLIAAKRSCAVIVDMLLQSFVPNSEIKIISPKVTEIIKSASRESNYITESNIVSEPL